ncbi:hypothetical protein IKE67_08715 [bacterium]|nr:hypothetical protein [bacterium]
MTKISKIKKSIENQENKIKNCIEFLEPSKKKEKTIKAYIVSDLWNEHSCIVFAETSGKAKSQALYDDVFAWNDSTFVELTARRMKEWDKYSESKKIPI